MGTLEHVLGVEGGLATAETVVDLELHVVAAGTSIMPTFPPRCHGVGETGPDVYFLTETAPEELARAERHRALDHG